MQVSPNISFLSCYLASKIGRDNTYMTWLVEILG